MSRTASDIQKAVDAVNTLVEIGTTSFIPEAKPTFADKLAMGLVSGTGGHIDACALAGNLLEDNNFHEMAAIVRALGEGKVTQVKDFQNLGQRQVIITYDYI